MDVNIHNDVELLHEYEEEASSHSSGVADPSGTGNELNTTSTGTVDPGSDALQGLLASNVIQENEDHPPEDGMGDSFLSHLADSFREQVGPSINAAVANVVNVQLQRSFARPTNGRSGNYDELSGQSSLVINKFKKLAVPSNTPELKSCRVNDGVYLAMNSVSKRANGDLHLVETACCKSTISTSLALDRLLDLQKSLGSSKLTSQFNEIFTLLADSVEFSCYARAKTNEVRREQIVASLNDQYKHLVAQTRPEKGWLFGSHLENDIKSVEVAARLSRKLAKPTSGPSSF